VLGAESPLLFLMGPTAAGKTELAVQLVARLPLEIVSVDSVMVYRGLDIGTGKPDTETLARAPHHLIDIRDPHECYSAAQFRTDALAAVEAIRARGRVPLLVGGTGLYFRALREGLSPLPAADPALRRRLDAEGRALGWPALHARLAALDPRAAARIRPSDPQRIQRALEVITLTGTPLSVLQDTGAAGGCPYPVHTLSLEPASRAWLHERIAARFQAMLLAGLEDEVLRLWQPGKLSLAMPSMRAVGYRQVIEHLEGRCTRRQMIAAALAATRQLARRQLTWLRRVGGAARVAADTPDRLDRLLAAVAPLLPG
jgi:tRNA dimethylallyltransferase